MKETRTYREDGQLLVSRRAFLYGGAILGAATAAGLGLASCGGDDGELNYLEVSGDSVVSLNDYNVIDNPDDKVSNLGTYDIPYGTLVWADDDVVAACLLPTGTGSPLTQIGILQLGSGELNTVLDRAVGFDEHFEIYDVRATSNGLIWTEANILQGNWRIYTAYLAGGAMGGAPVLVDQGDSSYDTPMLAVSSSRAFWQVLPKAGAEGNPPSRLMATGFGRSDSERVFESSKRMVTPPYSSADSITIAPRLNRSSGYCQLTNLNATSGDTNDTLTLPSGMTPLEAGYGQTGFMFSFSNIYNYGGGISNLGTYAPTSRPSDGNYSNTKWFRFPRTPTAAPAWCNNLLLVKSSYSVCGIDMRSGAYFTLNVDDGADDYGEYLASSGTHGNFVTFSNIDHKPIGADAIHTCRVKVWTSRG